MSGRARPCENALPVCMIAILWIGSIGSVQADDRFTLRSMLAQPAEPAPDRFVASATVVATPTLRSQDRRFTVQRAVPKGLICGPLADLIFRNGFEQDN
jgi:hypothetical protein